MDSELILLVIGILCQKKSFIWSAPSVCARACVCVWRAIGGKSVPSATKGSRSDPGVGNIHVRMSASVQVRFGDSSRPKGQSIYTLFCK